MSLSTAENARELFAREFGGEPDGVWSAPGRVNLIGEHTDYNDGLSLPIALPHRTFAAIRRRVDGRIRITSALRPGELVEADLAALTPGSGWADYVLGVAWALPATTGFDVALDSLVPVGAGLSSSAALECAVAVGLAAPDATTDALIRACVRAENEFVGAPTGSMDQTVSMRGQAGHALLVDFHDGALEQIPLDLEALGARLLVIDTRAAHSLADGEYARRRAECARAVELAGVPSLREFSGRLDDPLLDARARHVTSENARVLAFAAELRRPAPALPVLGALLDASHDSLRDDYEVSCLELDLAVDAARATGAHGARMTGGGFGGSAIALVDAADVDGVQSAVAQAFGRAGLAEPDFFTAVAAAGARQL